MERLNPVDAARQFVATFFPTCAGAILAGSAVRGEATETSDLDVVVFDSNLMNAYRESLIAFEWPIEVFVHNFSSYKEYFKSDCKRARPSLPRMVSEGLILIDNGKMEGIKREAQTLLKHGPEEWTQEDIQLKRYFITDVLDDFIGNRDRAEDLFIANALAELVSEFVLRTNRKWVGTSKWLLRSIRQFDENWTNEFVAVFDTFYRTGEKEQVVHFVEKTLEPYGGRLFEGFALGKSEQ